MKRNVAILFSLALLLAGLPLAATSVCAAVSAKACCRCEGQMACCAVTDSSPVSQLPAEPAPVTAQTHFHVVTWFVTAWLNTPVAASPKPDYFVSVSAPSNPVAIFARDCAFLI